MGKELAEHHRVARQTFEEADDALGYKLSQVCFEGPEDQLRLTEITQPAILTMSVAAWRVLQEKGIKPDFVAGHSLGEYSAHVAAGTVSFTDAVLMKPAQDRLAMDLKALTFEDAGIPVACNADAALVAAGEASRDALIRQVTGTVKWDPCMRLLIQKGVHSFVEVGPGKVLCGLMRQIDRSKTCVNVADEASLGKTLEQLAGARA